MLSTQKMDDQAIFHKITSGADGEGANSCFWQYHTQVDRETDLQSEGRLDHDI